VQKSRWQVLAVRATVLRPLASRLSHLDIPIDFARYTTVDEIDAENKQNMPNLENQFFTSMDVLLNEPLL
jgi:hypothetical protein